MPVGAYGGRRDVMSMVSPVGPVYQAGTLSGNPVAMSAGLAQLTILKEHPEIYRELNEKGAWFFGEIKKILKAKGQPWQVNTEGSLGSIFFTDQKVVDYASAKTSDTAEFARYFRYMLANGVYLGPSQFEAMFLSTAHTDEVIDETLEAMRGALGDL